VGLMTVSFTWLQPVRHID